MASEGVKTAEYFVGVDVGTGSARACVVDAEGEILSTVAKEIRMWQPQPGYYEQSTTDIWSSICHCVRTALTDAKVEAQYVRGIGFDATCSLAVLSHETSQPVSVTPPSFERDGDDRNVILWLDHRPEAETDAINATGHRLLRYVGGTMSIEMEMPKVLWLRNNMPAEKFAQCKFYDLVDALTHIATGAETRSLCSAVCKQGYVPVGVDGSVKGWQEDFYREIGLEALAEDGFKRVGGVDGVNGKFLSAGEYVGMLSKKASEELGLHEGVAVGSGVIDAYAGWIGTVGASADLPDEEGGGDAVDDIPHAAFTRLAAVAGTSTCHLAMSKESVFANGVWGPYRDVLVPGYWMNEGGQSATGELIRHVLETHPAHAEARESATKAGSTIYSFLDARLQELASKAGVPSIPFLAKHVFFYGDLWGNRSPIADAKMSGALVGMTGDRTIDNLALLYYAALEFIALQTRQIVEAMNGAGHELSSIFMSGSLSQNGLLMGLMATACGMPVVIPKYVHGAVVHGAAMLGAKAAASRGSDGAEKVDLWSIMRKMSRPGTVVKPWTGEAEKMLLEAKYGVFLDQAERQREYRRKMDEVVAQVGAR